MPYDADPQAPQDNASRPSPAEACAGASVAASILPKYQRYLYHLPTHTLPTSAYRGQAKRSTIHPTAEMHNQPYASPNAWCDEAPRNTTSPGMSMLFHKPRHQQADPLPDFTKSLDTSQPDAPANNRCYWRPVPTPHDQSHAAGTPGAPYTVSKKPDEGGAMEQQLQASPTEATTVFPRIRESAQCQSPLQSPHTRHRKGGSHGAAAPSIAYRGATPDSCRNRESPSSVTPYNPPTPDAEKGGAMEQQLQASEAEASQRIGKYPEAAFIACRVVSASVNCPQTAFGDAYGAGLGGELDTGSQAGCYRVPVDSQVPPKTTIPAGGEI